MGVKEQIEALRQQVVVLQDQMQIVLLMLSKPEPAQEPEPRIIIDFKDISFPI